MPRAIDFRQPTPDYDPNRSGTELHLTRYSEDAAKIIAEVMRQFVENIKQQLLDMISEITGIDLSTLSDLFLTVASPLNALNLFNIIPQYSMGFLPFTHLGEDAPNLLANPSFQGAESVQGSTIWQWDPDVGRTNPGCTFTVAAAAPRKLVSNAIPVTPDHEMVMSVWAKWAGLAYTGTPIKVKVLRLLNFEHVGVDDLAELVGPPADQTQWTQFVDTYSVPEGTDMVCLMLEVTTEATGGTVWFDDGDVRKLGSPFPFIPPFNVLGVGGPADIEQTISDTWDKLIAGFVGDQGGTGAAPADLFNIGYAISSWAAKGRQSWDILGIRDNKGLDTGLLPTSGANFGLSKVALQGTAPTIPVTATSSAMAFIRCEESNEKGVVSWLGYGKTNVTGCYVNIWQMNTTTGGLTLVHTSPNLVTEAAIPDTMNWVIYDEDFPILVHAGEVYGIEIQVVGTGTHNVSGSASWIPVHPNVYPRGYAAHRSTGAAPPAAGTVIPGASVVYATNVPWLEWGIHSVDVAGYHSPQTYLFNVPRTGPVQVPSWANFVDVIAVGSGAGGGGGGLYGVAQHNGGGAGVWRQATWARGTDFNAGDALDVTVTAGGVGGGTLIGVQKPGAATVVTLAGHTVTAPGGAISWGQDNGQGAGHVEWNGVTYEGGASQGAHGGAGTVPGGGGASGPDVFGGPGGPGATGAAWIVFRQN